MKLISNEAINVKLNLGPKLKDTIQLGLVISTMAFEQSALLMG